MSTPLLLLVIACRTPARLPDPPAAGATPALPSEVRVVVAGGGRGWVDLRAEVPPSLPRPVPLGEVWDAWVQPLPGAPPGRWTFVALDGSAPVDVPAAVREVVTLGAADGPAEGEDGPLPACGEPRVADALGVVPQGVVLAVPFGRRAPVVWDGEDVTEARRGAAEAALAEVWEGEGERRVSVTRYARPEGTWHLVSGTVDDGEGVCGGSSRTWSAFFRGGEGLGVAAGPWSAADFVEEVRAADIEGDGVPEAVRVSYPRTISVSGIGGETITEERVADCWCPC